MLLLNNKIWLSNESEKKNETPRCDKSSSI